jgi:hypothetical protein
LVLFLCGLAGRLGWIELPGHLSVLSHPVVLGASGLMLAVEFFADKLPWLDSLWDAAHTFIRIPAGAALVAMAAGGDSAAVTAAAVILGGTVAAGAHFAKAGARGAINLSPEPLSNWTASFAEDALVPAGLWLAVAQPAVFLALFAAGVLIALLLLRWLWRGLRAAAGRLKGA